MYDTYFGYIAVTKIPYQIIHMVPEIRLCCEAWRDIFRSISSQSEPRLLLKAGTAQADRIQYALLHRIYSPWKFSSCLFVEHICHLAQGSSTPIKHLSLVSHHAPSSFTISSSVVFETNENMAELNVDRFYERLNKIHAHFLKNRWVICFPKAAGVGSFVSSVQQLVVSDTDDWWQHRSVTKLLGPQFARPSSSSCSLCACAGQRYRLLTVRLRLF